MSLRILSALFLLFVCYSTIERLDFARKLVGRETAVDGFDGATVKSAISYVNNKVEFQIWATAGTDLTSILAVVTTKTSASAVEVRSVDECLVSKNGAVENDKAAICSKVLATLQTEASNKDTSRTIATPLQLATEDLKIKQLATKLRPTPPVIPSTPTPGTPGKSAKPPQPKFKQLKIGSTTSWDIVGATTLDKSKTGNVQKLVFVAKHTFSGPTAHASLLVVVHHDSTGFIADSVLYAVDGKAVEKVPGDISTDADMKAKLGEALAAQ